MTQPVILEDSAAPDKRQTGGKAFHLHTLMRQGFPVPGFFVLPAATIEMIVAPVAEKIATICASLATADDAAIAAAATELELLVTGLHMDNGLLQRISALCCQRFGENFRVAVRSSAIDEDGGRYSFAGQHATFLNVAAHSLQRCILHTIASCRSHGALAYRRLHGLPITGIGMAVVVQQMVDATKSGVGFSMNINGNLADMAIVAGPGAGEGVVNGSTDTDTYIVNREAQSVSVAQMAGDCRVLDSRELNNVCEYLEKAAKTLGMPADIEYSFDHEGRLFLLQLRPITTIKRDDIKILDNTNIVESYPGVSLPLTYSFIAVAYERVFKGCASAFMVSSGEMSRNEAVFCNLIAQSHGRVYYRLDNWYRMLGLVHHSGKSLKAWEQAVGLQEGAGDSVRFALRGRFRMAAALVRLLAGYRRGNDRFYREFQMHYARLRDHEAIHEPAALWRHYCTMTELLFRPWYLTVVNDFLAFKAFGYLREMVTRYRIGDESLANDLLCGTGGVESEEAMMGVMQLAEVVRNDKALLALFSGDTVSTWSALNRGGFDHFLSKLHAHLERFGDRTLEELKLETPSPRLHPELFLAMLHNQVPGGGTADAFRGKQAAIRKRAEQLVAERISGPKRLLFNIVRRLAAYGLKNRENMRFCRTRAYGAAKEIFLKMGAMMVHDGVLDAAEDVFYLQLGELRAYCEAGNRDKKQDAVAQTKANYEHYRRLSLPDRIMYTDQEPDFSEGPAAGVNSSGVLRGVAVSHGVVQAEAAIVHEPALGLDVRGKILVTRMTDPGWVFLMAQAAGMVSEKGSLLSHTAIVGRELGIPVVVGVAGATSAFKNGDVLRVDGSAGTVSLAAAGGDPVQ